MKMRTRTIRMNGLLKPVSEITDRAKRYRAQRNPPPPPKQCGFCGKRRTVEIAHVNGVEDDGEPENLMWTCRACNSTMAVILKNAGLGKRTRQYNPGRRPSQAEYAAAIKVMRGLWPGDVSKAVATIRATPPSVRSAYTAKTWPTRRALYGTSGRQSEIPF
jgi:hypothetical protein